MNGTASNGILGSVIDTIGSGVNLYLEGQNDRYRIEAARDIGVAQANASANQGLVNAEQFQMVLLGAAVLIGVMIWKAA